MENAGAATDTRFTPLFVPLAARRLAHHAQRDLHHSLPGSVRHFDGLVGDVSPAPSASASRSSALVAASAALHLWLDRLERLEDRLTPFSAADTAALDAVLCEARRAASRLGPVRRLPPGHPVAPGVAYVAVLKAIHVMARAGEADRLRSPLT